MMAVGGKPQADPGAAVENDKRPSAGRLLGSFAVDAALGAAPLVFAAPLVIPLLLSERPVDVHAGAAVALSLAGFGWLIYVLHAAGAALLAGGRTLGRRRAGLEVLCSSRALLLARALAGPLFFACCALLSAWPLLLLWPAAYLLLGRGPADALLRCRVIHAAQRRK